MNWLSKAFEFIGTALGGTKGKMSDFSDDLMKLPGYSPIADENFDSKNYKEQGSTSSVKNSALLGAYRSVLVKEFNTAYTSLSSLSDDAKAKKFFAKFASPNIST